MKLLIEPGKYVVAVSGGVDSVVLLHAIFHNPNSKLQLVVAHFDHGVRSDSALDRQLVEQMAAQYGLPFVYGEGELGAGVSEAAARQARYDFLYQQKDRLGARGIITAHHQDDLLETVILNLLRGTGRRGMSSLQSQPDLLRPLLGIPKVQLQKYATEHNLTWREDSTNQDLSYRRNYVRQKILPRFSTTQRQQLLQLVQSAATRNALIDDLLNQQLNPERLSRHWFIMLPHAVALEVMASWLRAHEFRQFDRRLLQGLVEAAKTYHPGTQIPITTNINLAITKDWLVWSNKSS